ncbi:MAG: hypothetical protein ABFC24_09250 [Methanoregulaceae archaeon]
MKSLSNIKMEMISTGFAATIIMISLAGKEEIHDNYAEEAKIPLKNSHEEYSQSPVPFSK